MSLYDGVAFGIERHGADGHPVSRVAGPARGIVFARLEVQGMLCSQNGPIVTGVTLSRT